MPIQYQRAVNHLLLRSEKQGRMGKNIGRVYSLQGTYQTTFIDHQLAVVEGWRF